MFWFTRETLLIIVSSLITETGMLVWFSSKTRLASRLWLIGLNCGLKRFINQSAGFFLITAACGGKNWLIHCSCRRMPSCCIRRSSCDKFSWVASRVRVFVWQRASRSVFRNRGAADCRSSSASGFNSTFVKRLPTGRCPFRIRNKTIPRLIVHCWVLLLQDFRVVDFAEWCWWVFLRAIVQSCEDRASHPCRG